MGIGPSGPVPSAIKGLMIANVLIYIMQISAPRYFFLENFALVGPLVLRGEIWRLGSYQFLHGGAWHLGINMLMLWMFGSELEQRWGPRFFLKYYFLCGVGGGLLYTLFMADAMVPSVGASGAIYGVLMAYGLWFPNRQVLLWFVVPIPVRTLVLFLILIEFLQSLQSSGSGIAHAAHLGGMAFGYVYLRWWGQRYGATLGTLPGLKDIRMAWLRWKFRRLQKRRIGGGEGGGSKGRGGPTLH